MRNKGVGVCWARWITFVLLSSRLVFSVYATERTTLYGITYDGILLEIDRTTGAGTQVRAQLAPEFRSIDSLEFVGDRFYASYDGGRIVQFGFRDGDETALGDSGMPFVEALAARSDDSLFASVSQDNIAQAESVGLVDRNTGAITNIVPSANQAVAYDMDALAFDTFNILYGINLDNPRTLFVFDPATGGISNAVTLSRIYWALAIQPRFNAFYASHAPSTDLTSLPSELFLLDPFSGSETFVGSIGHPNVSGLTFGPVPEPGSLLVLGVGLGVFTLRRFRVKRGM